MPWATVRVEDRDSRKNIMTRRSLAAAGGEEDAQFFDADDDDQGARAARLCFWVLGVWGGKFMNRLPNVVFFPPNAPRRVFGVLVSSVFTCLCHGASGKGCSERSFAPQWLPLGCLWKSCLDGDSLGKPWPTGKAAWPAGCWPVWSVDR